MTKSKIHLINILVLAVYMILLTILFNDAVLIISIIPIGLHIAVNFVLFLSHFNENRSISYTYLLSALLVLLIGFPSCWGLASVNGGFRI
jgi:ABC-type nickel/cobalt efflux system permease component RcnA